MSIDASLVLLHYNQSNCLRKTILALEQQKTDKTFEVIIADDGSNFKNLLEVENIIKTSSLPIQLVWQQDLFLDLPQKSEEPTMAFQGQTLSPLLLFSI